MLTLQWGVSGFVCGLDILWWPGTFQQYCSRFISFMDHGINAEKKHNFSPCKVESNNISKSAYSSLCCVYLKKDLIIIILCVEAYGIS